MIKTEQTWLDVMPTADVVPLTGAVSAWSDTFGPVIVLSTGHEFNGDPCAAVWVGAELEEMMLPLSELRANLDHPMGFGYAWLAASGSLRFEWAVDRYYIEATGQHGGYILIGLRINRPGIHGAPTDVEKLVLAKALAEVMS